MTTTEPLPLTRTVAGTEVPVPGTYEIDPSHTDVGFSVRHLMVARVRGSFPDVSGTVTIADDPLESSVEVQIGTASVDTRDAKRDEHLRSADFLDVEAHPVIRYRSTAVTPEADGTWTVDGELTVRGITRPVALSVRFEGGARSPWGSTSLGFSARAELDREAFGLTWNQATEAGGVLVGKQVRLEIEAETVRA